MAVGTAKIKSAGAAQSPLLGFAMFSPAVLYIVLLIGAPFVSPFFMRSVTPVSAATSCIMWAWRTFAVFCKAQVSGKR